VDGTSIVIEKDSGGVHAILGEFALLHDMLLPIQGVHHAGSLCNRTVLNLETASTQK
jgi:hypothetical protein